MTWSRNFTFLNALSKVSCEMPCLSADFLYKVSHSSNESSVDAVTEEIVMILITKKKNYNSKIV